MAAYWKCSYLEHEEILFYPESDRQAEHISLALNNVNLGSPRIETPAPRGTIFPLPTVW